MLTCSSIGLYLLICRTWDVHSLDYIAFFKRQFIGTLNDWRRLFGYRQEECSLGDCFLDIYPDDDDIYGETLFPADLRILHTYPLELKYSFTGLDMLMHAATFLFIGLDITVPIPIYKKFTNDTFIKWELSSIFGSFLLTYRVNKKNPQEFSYPTKMAITPSIFEQYG